MTAKPEDIFQQKTVDTVRERVRFMAIHYLANQCAPHELVLARMIDEVLGLEPDTVRVSTGGKNKVRIDIPLFLEF